MKRWFVLMLAAVLLLGAVPSDAAAYTCEDYYQCSAGNAVCYQITKDNAPLRAQPHHKGKVLTRLAEGQLLQVVEVVKNGKGNTWARVEYIDSSNSIHSAYMYTGNARAHEKHSFYITNKNDAGTIEVCSVCGYVEVTVGSRKAGASVLSVANQAVFGDFAQEDTDFWGLAARIVVGEIPYVGIGADLRDLLYDISHEEGASIVVADIVALAPLGSSIKHYSRLSDLRYVDDAAELGKVALDGAKYSFSSDAFRHMHSGDGIVGGKLMGTHEMRNFLNALSGPGNELTSVKYHPSIEGIAEVYYKTPGSQPWKKTLYDSDKIAFRQINGWAMEALSNGEITKKGLIRGTAGNGLIFEGAVEDGVITSFWPVVTARD